MRLGVKVIVDGDCTGEIVYVDSKISFFGEVDPYKGVIRNVNTVIRDKALVFRGGRGSTVGSYVIYALKYYGNAPRCMVVEKAEPIIIAGAVLADIPLFEVYEYNKLVESIMSGARKLVHRRGEDYIEVY